MSSVDIRTSDLVNDHAIWMKHDIFCQYEFNLLVLKPNCFTEYIHDMAADDLEMQKPAVIVLILWDKQVVVHEDWYW